MNILSKMFLWCFFGILACFSVSQFLAPDDAHGQMYRSVDANGRIVYSDRPHLTGATSYTPKQIGYISASGFPEPQKNSDHTTPAETPSSTVQTHADKPLPEFRFSNTSAGQKQGYVLMTGRISGGYACERLQVTARAISDTGRSKYGRDVVSYNGFGSTLYEIKKSSSWKGKGRRPQWEPANINAVCLD